MNWLLVIFIPLMLALVVLHRRMGRSAVGLLGAAGALPALLLSLAGDVEARVHVPWLFLGAWLGFGEIGPVFLFFTALLWFLAAIYAIGYLKEDSQQRRFFCFFLLTMSGNIGLLVSQDIASFYAFFALMTFSAYGLVIHTGTQEARRAGRIYLVMAILGELLLVLAIFLAVQAGSTLLIADLKSAIAVSPLRSMIVFPVLAGFGVKAGAVLVHFWLPLAHPVAPGPASAILSGAMIKAGLVGWLHLLPMGEAGLREWGFVVLLAGVAAAFYGVIVGLFQNDPKTNLAYSSISQMGVMTMGVGIALSAEAAWLPSLAVLQIYALNHALAKGALFLGVGVAAGAGRAGWKRSLALAGLILPALAIAGAPWTGGATAKHALKGAAGFAPDQWYPWLEWLLPLTSVGTALLLTRFTLLMWRRMKTVEEHPVGAAMWGSWLLLLAGVAVAAGFAIGHFALEIERSPATPAGVWSALWPMLLGVALLVGFHGVMSRRMKRRIPAGDIVVWVEAGARALKRRWDALGFTDAPSPLEVAVTRRFSKLLKREVDLSARADRFMTRWETAGFAFVLLLLVFLALV